MSLTLSSSSRSGCRMPGSLLAQAEKKSLPAKELEPAAVPACGCKRAGGVQRLLAGFTLVVTLTGLVCFIITGLLPVVLLAGALLLPALAPLLLVVLGLLASDAVPTDDPVTRKADGEKNN